ncbi:hypothetical protein ABZ700_14950 [Streptomyces diastaticus]|uniref:hypothetical protein n=1 Tax=Streptomyces diastaticus TaxID=1956 RepID=UPI0033FF1C44
MFGRKKETSPAAAELLAQAAADYGTPAERKKRAEAAKDQAAQAKQSAQDAAAAPRGRRKGLFG